MSMSVCVSVCLSVREDIPGTTRAIFTKFLYTLPYVRGSVLLRHVDDRPHRLSTGRGDGSAQRSAHPPLTNMLCTSGFVDDMFSNNGQNTDTGFESESVTSELFAVSRQVALLNCVPGAKSAIADCLVSVCF